MPALEPAIIARTADWLVADKPPGWFTIPGRDARSELPVLSDWLKERHGPLWVVHRLDRDTTGVILFARTAEAHRQAGGWFSDRKVAKTYHCLAVGHPRAPLLKLSMPIDEQRCLTQVEVREPYQEGFLAQVRPLTGRRHQIRIHLSQAGYPLWGDPEYGGPRELSLRGETLAIGRVALHASKLRLPDGAEFEAAWPADFASWVERLRKAGTRV